MTTAARRSGRRPSRRAAARAHRAVPARPSRAGRPVAEPAPPAQAWPGGEVGRCSSLGAVVLAGGRRVRGRPRHRAARRRPRTSRAPGSGTGRCRRRAAWPARRRHGSGGGFDPRPSGAPGGFGGRAGSALGGGLVDRRAPSIAVDRGLGHDQDGDRDHDHRRARRDHDVPSQAAAAASDVTAGSTVSPSSGFGGRRVRRAGAAAERRSRRRHREHRHRRPVTLGTAGDITIVPVTNVLAVTHEVTACTCSSSRTTRASPDS